jgi:transcriptional regulator with XRE-family HTH domain
MHYKKTDRLILGDHKKSTTEIFNSIHSMAQNSTNEDFKTFMQNNQNEFSYSPKVGEYIKTVMKSRNAEISIPQIAEITGISKSYLYQIIPAKDTPPKTTKNNPDRKMLLAVALSLNFSLDETQHLLKYAGEPELYPRSNFDAVIIYALERGLSVVKTNIMLDEQNCELLIFEK